MGTTFTMTSRVLQEERRINVYEPPRYGEDNEEDKKIAPRVGRSQLFRQFIREELIPTIRSRYATTVFAPRATPGGGNPQ
ncbi:MAG: hypothetical protein HQ485_09975 [Acidobacteria bacterium]|jgi:predicted alpha/beta superfamily hydrolase|nr:hypothetical protein [Acidobacteriota bacterium]